MSYKHAVRHDAVAGREPNAATHPHHATGAPRHVSGFWRHFWEMLVVMAAGMFVTGAIFVSVVGPKTWSEITFVYPTQALVAMAVGMTVPMVAWMLYRGMGWRTRTRWRWPCSFR